MHNILHIVFLCIPNHFYRLIIHLENSIKTQSSPSAPHLLMQLIMNMMKCPSFDSSDTCSFYFFLSYYLQVDLTYGCFMPSLVINTQLLIGSRLIYTHVHVLTDRKINWYCIVDVKWLKKALSISFKTCLVKR